MAKASRAQIDWVAEVALLLDGVDARLTEQLEALNKKKPSRIAKRQQFFAVAGEQLQRARAALAAYPKGAQGTYHAMQAESLSLIYDALQGGKIGSYRTKATTDLNVTRQQTAKASKAACRDIAATLNASLSLIDKARAVRKRLGPDARLPSIRTIRHYLSK